MGKWVWMFPSQQGIFSKALKCENYRISEFGLVLFTGLCLDALWSHMGSIDSKGIFCLPHAMKGRHYLSLCLWNVIVTIVLVGKVHRLIKWYWRIKPINASKPLICILSICVCVSCPGKMGKQIITTKCYDIVTILNNNPQQKFQIGSQGSFYQLWYSTI